MGYVHDTAMCQFIPPSLAMFSAGTWTDTVASNVWSKNRSAADASFTIYIPVLIPSNSVAMKGAKLVSVEVMYVIGTAAADDIPTATCILYKDTLAVTGTLNTAASAAGSLDTAHDSAAELKAADEHRLVYTLTTPAWIDNDEAYHFEIVVDAAATTVFKFLGALINYTLRV